MAFLVILYPGRVVSGSFCIRSSTNAHFGRVHKIVNDIGDVPVLDFVGSSGVPNAVHFQVIGVGISRFGVDLDRLENRRGLG